MTVLVTGATGCIGQALVCRLAAGSDPGVVRALVRPQSDISELPDAVEVVRASLEDGPEALRPAVRGVTTIFHTAARVHTPEGVDEPFYRANAEGTFHLLAACDAEGVAPRILLYSTVAVWGEETPEAGIYEDAPLFPLSAYAKSKAVAERAVLDWGGRRGAAPIILRVATVYGPRDRGNMARMIAAISGGRFILPDGGRNKKTCIALENLVRFSVALAQADSERVQGWILTLADPEGPYTLCELAHAMAEALGEKKQILSVPRALLLAAVGTLETAVGDRAPVTTHQIMRLAANNVYLARRCREILGDIKTIGLSEGMASAVEWWRAAEQAKKTAPVSQV